MRRGLEQLLDLLYPPRCAGCGRVDTAWCARCRRNLDAIPLDTVVRAVSPLAGVASTGPHAGALQQAVHALKYEGARKLAFPLAERLLARLALLDWTFDTVVPVPLHPTRERGRGYNQAMLLAQGIAQPLELPCVGSAITRRRDTRSQVGLSADERRANVRDAFLARPDLLAGRAVLLVDDVHTTGATLSACAEAILQAGASAVSGITVSVAL